MKDNRVMAGNPPRECVLVEGMPFDKEVIEEWGIDRLSQAEEALYKARRLLVPYDPELRASIDEARQKVGAAMRLAEQSIARDHQNSPLAS